MDANAIEREYVHGWQRLILLERMLGILGVVLLGIYCCVQLYAFVLSRAALYAINAYLTPSTTAVQEVGIEEVESDTDFTLWAKARIRAYRAISNLKLDAPIAVLNIPRLRLTVPVFEGTDPIALDRGVGRIAGTAALGTSGNIGIAGHRDGFFRVLKDIQPGDLIQIRSLSGEEVYAVNGKDVVDRRDVNVLHPTQSPSLTLVTCYPFYFVGAAPERFIVKAVLRQRTPRTAMPPAANTQESDSNEKGFADFPRHHSEIH